MYSVKTSKKVSSFVNHIYQAEEEKSKIKIEDEFFNILKDQEIFMICDDNGLTIFMYLMNNFYCTKSIVEKFLGDDKLKEKAGYINCPNRLDGNTAFHYLIANEHIDNQEKEDIIELMLGNDGDLNITNKQGEAPLTAILCNKKLSEKLKREIVQNVGNKQDKKLNTALHRLIYDPRISLSKKENIVKLMLSHGYDLNIFNERKESPLTLIIFNKQFPINFKKEIAKVFANKQDEHGNTALHRLIYDHGVDPNKKEDIIYLLLNYDVDFNIINNDGVSPIAAILLAGNLSSSLIKEALILQKDKLATNEKNHIFQIVFSKRNNLKDVESLPSSEFEQIFENECEKKIQHKGLLIALLETNKISDSQSLHINNLFQAELKEDFKEKFKEKFKGDFKDSHFLSTLIKTKQITDKESLSLLFREQCAKKPPNSDLLIALLKTGDVMPDSYVNEKGRTLLFYAVISNDPALLKTLIERKADLKHKDINKATAVDILKKLMNNKNSSEYNKISELLLEKNQRNNNQKTNNKQEESPNQLANNSINIFSSIKNDIEKSNFHVIEKINDLSKTLTIFFSFNLEEYSLYSKITHIFEYFEDVLFKNKMGSGQNTENTKNQTIANFIDALGDFSFQMLQALDKAAFVRNCTSDTKACRYDLLQNENEPQRDISQLLKDNIPEDSALGGSINKADGLYDAVAQGINQLKQRKQHSVKSLREICHTVAKQLDKQCQGLWNHQNNWLGKQLRNEEKYNEYLANVQFTAAECEKMKKIAIAGTQHIDAKILSAVLDITIHVVDVWEDSNKNNALHLAHTLISENQLHYNIEEKDITYDNTTICLALYREYFVPALKKNLLNNLHHYYQMNSTGSSNQISSALRLQEKKIYPLEKIYFLVASAACFTRQYYFSRPCQLDSTRIMEERIKKYKESYTVAKLVYLNASKHHFPTLSNGHIKIYTEICGLKAKFRSKFVNYLCLCEKEKINSTKKLNEFNKFILELKHETNQSLVEANKLSKEYLTEIELITNYSNKILKPISKEEFSFTFKQFLNKLEESVLQAEKEFSEPETAQLNAKDKFDSIFTVYWQSTEEYINDLTFNPKRMAQENEIIVLLKIAKYYFYYCTMNHSFAFEKNGSFNFLVMNTFAIYEKALKSKSSRNMAKSSQTEITNLIDEINELQTFFVFLSKFPVEKISGDNVNHWLKQCPNKNLNSLLFCGLVGKLWKNRATIEISNIPRLLISLDSFLQQIEISVFPYMQKTYNLDMMLYLLNFLKVKQNKKEKLSDIKIIDDICEKMERKFNHKNTVFKTAISSLPKDKKQFEFEEKVKNIEKDNKEKHKKEQQEKISKPKPFNFFSEKNDGANKKEDITYNKKAPRENQDNDGYAMIFKNIDIAVENHIKLIGSVHKKNTRVFSNNDDITNSFNPTRLSYNKTKELITNQFLKLKENKEIKLTEKRTCRLVLKYYENLLEFKDYIFKVKNWASDYEFLMNKMLGSNEIKEEEKKSLSILKKLIRDHQDTARSIQKNLRLITTKLGSFKNNLYYSAYNNTIESLLETVNNLLEEHINQQVLRPKAELIDAVLLIFSEQKINFSEESVLTEKLKRKINNKIFCLDKADYLLQENNGFSDILKTKLHLLVKEKISKFRKLLQRDKGIEERKLRRSPEKKMDNHTTNNISESWHDKNEEISSNISISSSFPINKEKPKEKNIFIKTAKYWIWDSKSNNQNPSMIKKFYNLFLCEGSMINYTPSFNKLRRGVEKTDDLLKDNDNTTCVEYTRLLTITLFLSIHFDDAPYTETANELKEFIETEEHAKQLRWLPNNELNRIYNLLGYLPIMNSENVSTQITNLYQHCHYLENVMIEQKITVDYYAFIIYAKSISKKISLVEDMVTVNNNPGELADLAISLIGHMQFIINNKNNIFENWNVRTDFEKNNILYFAYQMLSDILEFLLLPRPTNQQLFIEHVQQLNELNQELYFWLSDFAETSSFCSLDKDLINYDLYNHVLYKKIELQDHLLIINNTIPQESHQSQPVPQDERKEDEEVSFLLTN